MKELGPGLGGSSGNHSHFRIDSEKWEADLVWKERNAFDVDRFLLPQ